MAKEKTIYLCSACGYETPRWMGKCPGCNAWNTLEEQAPQVQHSKMLSIISERSIASRFTREIPSARARAVFLSCPVAFPIGQIW